MSTEGWFQSTSCSPRREFCETCQGGYQAVKSTTAGKLSVSACTHDSLLNLFKFDGKDPEMALDAMDNVLNKAQATCQLGCTNAVDQHSGQTSPRSCWKNQAV